MTHDKDREAREKVAEGFRRVGLTFPYLTGLIGALDVQLDRRLDTAAVFATGRMVINPDFVAGLSPTDLMFVLTHELFHLTLRTHDRGVGSDPLDFNFAHDYIINDLLCEELQIHQPPAGGLHWPGARKLSAEKLIEEIRRMREVNEPPLSSFASNQSGGVPRARRGRRTPTEPRGDVLDAAQEREWFPELGNEDQEAKIDVVRKKAAHALALQALMETGKGHDAGGAEDSVAALRGLYRPPWELALQRWLESVSPSARSYARPSRRGADRTDVVLPGRKREGWMLHVILDTSGSMIDELPRALGAIADFCEAVGAEQIRVVQCDTSVAADETLSPAELARWTIKGYGGSDLAPAMRRLAEENDVEAAVILTDGDIDYPKEAVPYTVLWVLPASSAGRGFAPPYGQVMPMN